MRRLEKHLRRWTLFAVMVLVFSLSTPRGGGTAETSPTAEPGQERILRLEDAVRIALENHPKIKGAQQDVGAQEAVLNQELGAYYPTVAFSGNYRSSNSTGGGDSTTQEAFDRFSGSATFTMTLYNFGKREGTIQSARGTLDATQYSYRASVDEVVLAVKQAYYGYLQAASLVKVREATVKDRELLVRQAQGFYEVGTKPKIDVARAESNLFNARADLIAAENAVKVGWATLKNALGVPDFLERPLAEGPPIAAPQVSLSEAKEIGFKSRPDLLQLEAQRKAKDQDIATARRGHLPDINFNANYGRQNTSRSGNTFPLQVSWTAGVTLSMPIFDGFRTTYKVQEALRNYHGARAGEDEKKQQVALEVESSYLKLLESQGRIKATEAAAAAAKENLDLANGRYQVGVGSIIEVTEAQTLYTDAQTKHIQSIYDYKIAEAQLAKAIGRQ